MKKSAFWLFMTVCFVLPCGLGLIWANDMLTLIFGSLGAASGVVYTIQRRLEKQAMRKEQKHE